MRPLVLCAFALVSEQALACEVCRPSVFARVLNDDFFLTFAILLLPLGATLFLAWVLVAVTSAAGSNG